MKRITVILIALVLVIFGIYSYLVRPIPVPTEDVQTVTDTLKPMTNVSHLYRISDQSKARFEMNEILYGKPKLVVGTTTKLAGDIAITNNHIQMGEMKLDARTLTTDNEKRNGAINRLILKTTTVGNEYVVFRPLANDFTGTIVLGTPVTFNVTGDLTISRVTKQVVFAISMTVNETTLVGRAQANIKRSDFGIKIPNLSFIANVDDEFPIIVDVVAERVEK